MCSKKRYETFWDARLALTAVQGKFRRSGRPAPSGAHPCSACRGWHLTSHGGYTEAPWVPRHASG